MRTLRFLHEFFTYCLWESQPYCGEDEINASHLPISNDLVKDIHKFEYLYQSTYDSLYPPDSGFETEEEAKKSIKLYRELANRLRNELGNKYKIIEYINPETYFIVRHMHIAR